MTTVAGRAYARKLNALVEESTAYQQNAKLRYMTAEDVDRAFEAGPDEMHRLE